MTHVAKINDHFRSTALLDRLAPVQYREHLAQLKSLLERTQDLPEVMPHGERSRLHELVAMGIARLNERDRAPVTTFDAKALHALIQKEKKAIWTRAEASAAKQGLCAILMLREVR